MSVLLSGLPACLPFCLSWPASFRASAARSANSLCTSVLAAFLQRLLKRFAVVVLRVLHPALSFVLHAHDKREESVQLYTVSPLIACYPPLQPSLLTYVFPPLNENKASEFIMELRHCLASPSFSVSLYLYFLLCSSLS